MIKLLPRFQLQLFIIAAFVVGSAFAWQIFKIIPIYRYTDIREEVRNVVMETSDQRGWLLSGISLNEVTESSIIFDYIDRRRGSDVVTCHMLTLSDRSLHSCDAAR